MENEKQSIVEQLRTLLSEGDVTAIKEQVAELKNHFYRIVHQEQENLRKAAEEFISKEKVLVSGMIREE